MIKNMLSLVIPAYNEEKRLERSLKKMLLFLKKNFSKFEIIIVDDGSTDRTVEIVNNFQKKTKKILLLRNKKNRGKGFSVKKGLLKARGEFILFSDSDLATPIEESLKLLYYIKKGYDVVIASRNLRDSNIIVKQPLYRQLAGKVFPLLAKLFIGNIKDSQCGFKMFRYRAAKVLAKKQRIFRFAFDVELIFLARKLGFKLKEVSVVWVDQKGTKVNFFKDGPKMIFDLLRIAFFYFFDIYHLKFLKKKSLEIT